MCSRSVAKWSVISFILLLLLLLLFSSHLRGGCLLTHLIDVCSEVEVNLFVAAVYVVVVVVLVLQVPVKQLLLTISQVI